MQRLRIDESCYVLVLTGAGASAESGIPTFRDANGVWNSHRFEDVASPQGFVRDPQLVWRFYSERRATALEARPNPGHLALAELEERLRERMLLVTQNVDGLHQRAGSKRVVEMHGNLLKTRCSACARDPFDDHSLYEERTPMCEICRARGTSAPLRPHIVWFGEMLDPQVHESIEGFMRRAGKSLLFLAVGTSGSVYPAAALVNAARRQGGRCILVNLEEADNTSRFDQVWRGKSGELLPALLAEE